MNGFKISEAAVQSGFSESALRFYEQQGVVVPERTPAGYRTYNKDDMEALQFVARAKRLGLNLGEISELLSLLEDEQCRPVQDRMRVLVAKRLNETQTKIGEMIAFAGQLQEVAARLGTHTPGGACDDDCGCKFDISNVKVRSLVSLGRPTDVACSLEPGLAPDRIKDWKALLAQAVDRQFVRDVSESPFSAASTSSQSANSQPANRIAVNSSTSPSTSPLAR